jgi:glycosyltransferase involved in cell wall biosynthesis
MIPDEKPLVSYLTNCYAPPDQVGAGPSTRHYYHVDTLADSGMQVDVVTTSASTITTTLISPKSSRSEVRVKIVPTSSVTKDSIAARIKHHMLFFLRSFSEAMKTRRPVMVISSIPSLLVGWQGYLSARLHNARFLLDVRDLWSDSLKSTNLANLPLFLSINRLLEKSLYKKADLITCTSKAQAKEIRKMIHNQTQIHFVPNGLDPEIVASPSIPHPQVQKIKQQYNWVGLYAGKHSHYSGLDTLLTAAKDLEKEGFALLLVGGGYTKTGLKKRVKEENIMNVFFHDPVPKKNIAAFLAGADIFFVNYSKDGAWEKVLPNKVFDYMYWNRPIIAAVVPGEITRVISESGAGISVPPGDPSAIVRAVRRCMENRMSYINPRKYLLEHFDRKNTVKKFVEAVQIGINIK